MVDAAKGSDRRRPLALFDAAGIQLHAPESIALFIAAEIVQRLDLQLRVDLADALTALDVGIVPVGLEELEPCAAGGRLRPGDRRRVRKMNSKSGPSTTLK